ncbi:hypothetical protein Hdeb2414_s0001g00020591 [Helianthus debilis subsp. tardiflorus]
MKRVTALKMIRFLKTSKLHQDKFGIPYSGSYGSQAKVGRKFPKEFADPPTEYTAEGRAQMDKEHEETIDRYIQNPPRTANHKKKQKEVIMMNVGAKRNFGFQDQPHRYMITTEKYRFDVCHNRSGIVSWVYNDEKGMFLVKRKNGAVEYYNYADAFKSWTIVDLRELSKASYHD